MSANKSAWRSPWVLAWVGIVLVVLTVNFYMIYLSIGANPGLVVDDYYERGQDYEKTMLQRMAKDPGWNMQIEAPNNPVQGQPIAVRFTVSDKSGQPVSVEKVTFFAYRPSDEQQDFSQPMVQQAPGVYVAEVTFPLKGVWDSLASVQQGDEEYNQAQRFIVSSGQ